MIHIEQFIFNPFQTRCSVVWNEDKTCVIIDPGYIDAEREQIVAFIEEKKLIPTAILLTHGHFDHIYGLTDLSRTYNIPVYMDMKETFSFEKTNPYVCSMCGLPLPELPEEDIFINLKDGDSVESGKITFEVIGTPGHSVGGLCFLLREAKVLFCGDTLFAGAIGRTDHPGGDYDLLMESIFGKLMPLDGDITVIPGHGPCSDIATERMTNPFLMPFNEPYED